MRQFGLGAVLLCLACAGFPTPEAPAPLTPEEKYQAWRKEHGRPDRPTEGGDDPFGDFHFYYVSGPRTKPIDRVAISSTTLLHGDEQGDWGALLRTGDAAGVHGWVGWLNGVYEIEPDDIDARQPPLAAYYTPPTVLTEGESTRFQGWYVAYPSGSFARLTVVASSERATSFTWDNLDKMLEGTP